mgnify:CR=1 FL=1
MAYMSAKSTHFGMPRTKADSKSGAFVPSTTRGTTAHSSEKAA